MGPGPHPNIREAALLDTASTAVAIDHGFVEANPVGFPATIAIKALLIYGMRPHFTEDERRMVDRAASTFWTGASANNIALVLGAATPVAISAGIITGVIIFITH